MPELPAHLKDLFASGRVILSDSKQRKAPAPGGKPKKGPATANLAAPPETDPYKIFIRKCVNEKIKKADMVKDIERFIKVAEEAL